MKILYIESTGKVCNYYSDMILYLSKISVLKHIPFEKKMIITQIKEFNPDVIILGFKVMDSGNNGPSIKLNLDTKIPIYVILNKEYAGLQNKLNWIKDINPGVKKVFSVHHDVLKYQEYCNIPFTRIMWSAESSIFKKYDNEYKHDFFFSGVIRKEQTGNLREKIHSKLDALSKYNLLVRAAFYRNNKLSGKIYTFKNNEYAKTINHSKIVLTTTGPADLVGTRYFEIMASNKALILCNRMPEEVYGDVVIDKMNCVMFDDENDFVEKCKYYLEHEEERMKIVTKAYEYFLERHTWDHKVKHLISNL